MVWWFGRSAAPEPHEATGDTRQYQLNKDVAKAKRFRAAEIQTKVRGEVARDGVGRAPQRERQSEIYLNDRARALRKRKGS